MGSVVEEKEKRESRNRALLPKGNSAECISEISGIAPRLGDDRCMDAVPEHEAALSSVMVFGSQPDGYD